MLSWKLPLENDVHVQVLSPGGVHVGVDSYKTIQPSRLIVRSTV